MASLPIYNRTGQQVGSYDIDPAAIAPNINKQLLHDVVVMYQSNQRVGTAKTKSRAEVAGSTKKMYRQKGTGNARAGGRRSPVRRGGGHTFAKRPRLVLPVAEEGRAARDSDGVGFEDYQRADRGDR